MKPKLVGILQVRLNSSRLPDKALVDIQGRTALEVQLARLDACPELDQIVIATTVNPRDDRLEQLAAKLGRPCFRGSEEDVLDRFYQAARQFEAGHICRLTGDCPLVDPKMVGRLARHYLALQPDIVYVNGGPTYPEGSTGCEFFSFAALERSWQEAEDPVEREHVTQYIRRRPGEFPAGRLAHDPDLGRFRFTMDEPQDLEVIRLIIRELGFGPEVGVPQICEFLREHPEVDKINNWIIRNEGLLRSRMKAAGKAHSAKSG